MSDVLSPQLNQLLQTFATDHLEGGTTSTAYQTLHLAVSSSPWLILQMDMALADGRLKKLDILEEDSPRGAEYGSGTIRIKLNDLRDPNDLNFLIKSLGHETQHALFDDKQAELAWKRFAEKVEILAASKELEHDYTQALKEILGHRAENEARAEIAGWNAVVSYERTQNPNITFDELAKATESFSSVFITNDRSVEPITYTLKPGLTLNADLSMDDSSANIQAMTEYYYYALPLQSGFGHHEDSDYSNDYAAPLIDQICWKEQEYQQKTPDREPPHLLLDMQGLHLSERLLERNGLYLGGEDRQCRYFTTDEPNRAHYFDHTGQTHEHSPNLPDGTRLPPPPELSPEARNSYTTDESGTPAGPFELGRVLPPPDEKLPESPVDERTEPVLSPTVQRLKDDLDEQLKPKLMATGCCREHHADAMVAEGVKRCVERGAESIVFTGIDEKRNLLVLQTDKGHDGLVVYDAIAASRKDPEQTLHEAEQMVCGKQTQQIQEQDREQEKQLDFEYLDQQAQQLVQQQELQQQFLREFELRRVLKIEQ